MPICVVAGWASTNFFRSANCVPRLVLEPSSINSQSCRPFWPRKGSRLGNLHVLLVLRNQNVIYSQLRGGRILWPGAVTMTLTGDPGAGDVARGQATPR